MSMDMGFAIGLGSFLLGAAGLATFAVWIRLRDEHRRRMTEQDEELNGWTRLK